MHTHSPAQNEPEAEEGGGHWIWMVLCCLPMIAFVVLVGLGIWSFT